MQEVSLKRFLSQVSAFKGCLEWIGSIDAWGYGSVTIDKKVLKAHRVSYELFFGKIPEGMGILHRCDNPKCINPLHLFPGTPADNVHDMIAKGRKKQARGEKAGKSKLTNEQVLEIRRIYSPGIKEFNTVALGKRYGVTSVSISKIIKRINWTHI